MTSAPLPPASAEPPLTEASARHLGPVRRYFAEHPVAMDVVVILWFLVPALAGLVLTATAPANLTKADVPVILALMVVGAVALVWRRRRPVLVAAAMGALAALSLWLTGTLSGFDLGIALAVYAVAAARTSRTAWLTVGVLALAVGAAVLLWESPVAVPTIPEVPPGEDPAPSDFRAATITSLVLFMLAALAIGTSVRNRRLHVADLVERTNALARDRDQQARLARAAERSRIAREMHDVVAHSLSVMIALADGAGAALDRAPDRSRAALDELGSTGRSALADMRRMLGVLNEPDAPFEPQPGSTDLEELVERFRTAGLAVRTTGLRTPLPPDAGIQLAVYRIVSEALTNALRHAPGTSQVDVVLQRSEDAVEIEVTDQGATVSPHDVGAGQGVIGMRERASVYGGTVEAGPWREGWRVHAILPWTAEEST